VGPSSISAVFPTRDAASTIASVVVVADRVLRTLTDDYEILVVDAGSIDHTPAILRDLLSGYPRLRLRSCAREQGPGGALRYGLAAAEKELIIYAPGDARYDPRDFTRLLDALAPDVDVVDGFRTHRRDGLAPRTQRGLLRRMFGLLTGAVEGECRLLRRSVLDRVRLEENGDLVHLELAAKARQAAYRVRETPISYCDRFDPGAGLPRLVSTAGTGARLWWRLQWRGEFRRALAEQDAIDQIVAGNALLSVNVPPAPLAAGCEEGTPLGTRVAELPGAAAALPQR
jgi:glycosyltransferase involved in cell wall biosynthesis